MIISDQHRAAFIHIPKCGGTSVRGQLSSIDSTGGRFLKPLEHPTLGYIHMAHIPLVFLADQFPEEFAKVSRYRTFALVRDPYARFASAVFQRIDEFKGVAKLQVKADLALREAREATQWLGGRRAFCDAAFIHFSRQSDFLNLNGRRVVSDAFALENIAGFATALEAASGVKLDADRRDNSNFASKNPVLAVLHGAKPVYSRLTTWKFRKNIVVTLQKMGAYSSNSLYAVIIQDPEVRAFIDDYYAEDFEIYQSLIGPGKATGRPGTVPGRPIQLAPTATEAAGRRL